MKKIFEKVALAAFICISLIFVLICVLTYLNIIPMHYDNGFNIDWVVMVILLVLASIWALLALYLVYCNFSQRSALKYVILYSDRQSSTKATSRVIKQLAVAESNQLKGVRISKITITSNEHLGLNMKLVVEVANDEVAFSLDTLRFLLTDKYREVLGLEFAAMDFQIKRVRSNYRPDITKAKENADRLGTKRKSCASTPATCHIEASENEQGETSGGLAIPAAPESDDDALVAGEDLQRNVDENQAEKSNKDDIDDLNPTYGANEATIADEEDSVDRIAAEEQGGAGKQQKEENTEKEEE